MNPPLTFDPFLQMLGRKKIKLEQYTLHAFLYSNKASFQNFNISKNRDEF